MNLRRLSDGYKLHSKISLYITTHDYERGVEGLDPDSWPCDRKKGSVAQRAAGVIFVTMTTRKESRHHDGRGATSHTWQSGPLQLEQWYTLLHSNINQSTKFPSELPGMRRDHIAEVLWGPNFSLFTEILTNFFYLANRKINRCSRFGWNR